MTLRADQLGLLRWVLGRTDLAAPTDLPALDIDRFGAAGLGTGLTALVARLLGDETPEHWRALLTEQADQVARRSARFATLLPQVLGLLDEAGVAATPVKGAVLTTPDGWWRWPGTRPMSDIDLLVAPGDLGRARRAMTSMGHRLERSTAYEDSFLVWGDGGTGRTDGESVDHNGKVEIHPGWVESVGAHLLDGTSVILADRAPGVLAGSPAFLLSPGGFTTHVLGHLSSTVVRREVRAVNVVDTALCLAAIGDDERRTAAALWARLDPRLVAPGVWLLRSLGLDTGGGSLADAGSQALERCRRTVDHLDTVGPAGVLREMGTGTPLRWRWGLARGLGEKARVLRGAVGGRLRSRSR